MNLGTKEMVATDQLLSGSGRFLMSGVSSDADSSSHPDLDLWIDHSDPFKQKDYVNIQIRFSDLPHLLSLPFDPRPPSNYGFFEVF
jgi:hypothetical protein